MPKQTSKQNKTIGLDYERLECYPFVKWAGGKSQLLRNLDEFIPQDFNRYFEPFVGGGAFFFYLKLQKNHKLRSVISDINQELINAYVVIKNNVEELITVLRVFEKGYNQNPTEYYYKLRANLNGLDTVERAARFITLNKTCYNGLYRVNNDGIFNVPIGRYKHPLICDASNLRNISLILRSGEIEIDSADYKSILLEKSKKGDFVYLDPPYSPVSATSNFTGYTSSRFTDVDQRILADVFRKLDRRGCFVLLSNSDSPFIENLYDKRGIYKTKVNVTRAINSNGSKRTGHKELLIRNYE